MTLLIDDENPGDADVTIELGAIDDGEIVPCTRAAFRSSNARVLRALSSHAAHIRALGRSAACVTGVPQVQIVVRVDGDQVLEVRVPERAKAGEFEGCLSINADGTVTELPVTLRVWDFEVPQERHLSVVNWWQFPGVGFEDRSPDDWDLLRRFVTFLVEHRQTDLAAEIRRIEKMAERRLEIVGDFCGVRRETRPRRAATNPRRDPIVACADVEP